jgi:hypothetical protein
VEPLVLSEPLVSTVLEIDAHLRGDLLADALVLEVVLAGSWRVCDARVAANTPGHVLAFVDERKGVFQVMQLADIFVWSTFSTMHLALAHVVDTHAAVVAARSTGELAWLG